MYGMRNTETEILTQAGGSSELGTHIMQEQQNNRISQDLLRGEVTQQVEELRYRTYKVDREAKQYEYFSPTLAKKRDKNDSKFVVYENADNNELITIQYNEPITENVNSSLENVVSEKGKLVFKDGKKRYMIKIGRNHTSRYKLEGFTKRLVVKQLIKDRRVVLDFYVSKYMNDQNFISKGFITETHNIMDGYVNSDTVDISTVNFVTDHAYGKDDMLEYEFNHIAFYTILEYDGNYIYRFHADVVKNGVDLTEKYFNKEMDEKYINKEKKAITLDFSKKAEVYVCEQCGKEIIYDENLIDEITPTKPRDIDEENSNVETVNATEYMDIQIAEQTYGVRLCKDCLKKYLKEINELS